MHRLGRPMTEMMTLPWQRCRRVRLEGEEVWVARSTLRRMLRAMWKRWNLLTYVSVMAPN